MTVVINARNLSVVSAQTLSSCLTPQQRVNDPPAVLRSMSTDAGKEKMFARARFSTSAEPLWARYRLTLRCRVLTPGLMYGDRPGNYYRRITTVSVRGRHWHYHTVISNPLLESPLMIVALYLTFPRPLGHRAGHRPSIYSGGKTTSLRQRSLAVVNMCI